MPTCTEVGIAAVVVVFGSEAYGVGWLVRDHWFHRQCTNSLAEHFLCWGKEQLKFPFSLLSLTSKTDSNTKIRMEYNFVTLSHV